MARRVMAIALAAAVLAAGAEADTVRRERVAFPAGTTGTTIDGSVSGYDSVEYQLAAVAGQEMAVALDSANPQAYFNVFAPGDVPGESTALHNGARDGLDWRGTLEESGDYTVQVFLTRAAARRAETAAYALKLELSPPGQ